jgi:hypothetical protein
VLAILVVTIGSGKSFLVRDTGNLGVTSPTLVLAILILSMTVMSVILPMAAVSMLLAALWVESTLVS